MMATTTREPICYGQVNTGNWCQETYESASRDAARRARILRKAGYIVTVIPMGPQVTRVGVVNLTMVDIRPGKGMADTFYLPPVKIERL